MLSPIENLPNWEEKCEVVFVNIKIKDITVTNEINKNRFKIF